MTVERLICDLLGFQSDHVRRRTLCKSISLTMNLEDHTDDTDDVLGKLYFKVELWCVFFLRNFLFCFQISYCFHSETLHVTVQKIKYFTSHILDENLVIR